ncbi:hypothetical protein GCM10010121_064380 [Streptomyces brasiliensis]|uniref:MmyB-like transcription regulator ligand binding domain-containing protein n=1 Tax=Streptomyces brasiliensis TaxID=1954 RepID=A0A917L4H7_9ACTN|nr:hypothetical protein GCM10010121_064380 [Streptomyces brasiliensis]
MDEQSRPDPETTATALPASGSRRSAFRPRHGPDFTRRLNRHVVPRRGVLRLNHPSGCELQMLRETLELPSDAQQLVVFLPADEKTAQAVDRLRRRPQDRLRAIS